MHKSFADPGSDVIRNIPLPLRKRSTESDCYFQKLPGKFPVSGNSGGSANSRVHARVFDRAICQTVFVTASRHGRRRIFAADSRTAILPAFKPIVNRFGYFSNRSKARDLQLSRPLYGGVRGGI